MLNVVRYLYRVHAMRVVNCRNVVYYDRPNYVVIELPNYYIASWSETNRWYGSFEFPKLSAYDDYQSTVCAACLYYPPTDDL